jgi:hypothetical protein
VKNILNKWEKFSTERVVYSYKELIDTVRDDPNQNIYLDNPKGTEKKFGGLTKNVLPFDYGEWPELVNPADNMGWDLIIVPSSTKKDDNLLPVGYVQYKDEDKVWEKVGKEKPVNIKQNTKIIIASNEKYNDNDKKIIENFFENLIQFQKVVWL